MLPKLLLLFAMILISIRVINVIHNNLFIKELCKDGFYDGGIVIRPLVNNQIKRRVNDITKQTKQTKQTNNSNYASYGAYKKMKALS